MELTPRPFCKYAGSPLPCWAEPQRLARRPSCLTKYVHLYRRPTQMHLHRLRSTPALLSHNANRNNGTIGTNPGDALPIVGFGRSKATYAVPWASFELGLDCSLGRASYGSTSFPSRSGWSHHPESIIAILIPGCPEYSMRCLSRSIHAIGSHQFIVWIKHPIFL